MTQSTKNPNLAVIEQFFDAYAKEDFDGIRAVLAPDVRWTIPGHHPLAGIKTSADEVIAFFQQLDKSTFKATTLFMEANDEWVVELHRGWNEKGKAQVDMLWVLVYRIETGKIKEVTNFAADQHAADSMFWANYPLAPIPQRLL